MSIKTEICFCTILLFSPAYCDYLERAASSLINSFNQNKFNEIFVFNHAENFEMQILLGNLWNDKGLGVKVFDRRASNVQYARVKACVMTFDREESFLETFKSFNLTQFDVHGFYVIVFAASVEVNTSTIFEMMWRKSFYNVNILIASDNKGVELSTFFPFQPNKCHATHSTAINWFDKNSWANRDFFPKKLKNFHKCPIRFGFHEITGRFHRKAHDNGTAYYVGSDARILQVLVDALNFQPKINFSNKSNDFGGVYDNGTGFGVLNQLTTGQSDMVISYILDARRLRFLDVSDTGFVYLAVVIIPKGAPYTSLENLLRPFSITVWLTVLTFIGAMLAFILVLKHFSRTGGMFISDLKSLTHCYNFMMMIIGGPVNKPPKRSSGRICMSTIIMTALVLRTVYQTKMFKFFQAGHDKVMVRTLEDMEERGFKLHVEARMDLVMGSIINYPDRYFSQIVMKLKIYSFLPKAQGQNPDERRSVQAKRVDFQPKIQGRSFGYTRCKHSE